MGYIENQVAYDAAIKRNIRMNARKTFMKRDRADEVVDWLYTARGEFAGSLLAALENYGKLTDKQFAAVLKCVDGAAARKAEFEAKRMENALKSAWVGSVGEKVSLTNVKVEAVVTVACPAFFYNDRNEQEIYLLRDEAGNRLVFRTKKYMEIKKGDTVNVTAKIKEQSEYKGERQTIINYAKFAPVAIVE